MRSADTIRSADNNGSQFRRETSPHVEFPGRQGDVLMRLCESDNIVPLSR